MKEYCKIWATLKSFDLSDSNLAFHLFDGFKEITNKKLKLALDFSKKEITEIRALFIIRNGLIHTNGILEKSYKSFQLVSQLTKKYKSLQLLDDKFIVIDEQFCHDALSILKRFIFYIVSKAIRSFPNYRKQAPKWLLK
jgi:hypothetical protein